MATKIDLKNWVKEAIEDFDGKATIIEISRHIWNNHEVELRNSGDLFYTWQYDMRWGAYHLRKEGIIKSAELSPQGIWELK